MLTVTLIALLCRLSVCAFVIIPPRLAGLCDRSFCHSFCLWAR